MAKRLLSQSLSLVFTVNRQCRTITSCISSPSVLCSRFNGKYCQLLSPNATLKLCSPAQAGASGEYYKSHKRHMAGHSKWQNIKHIKGAKDAQKRMMASEVVRRIKVAIREGGSDNPQFNYKLAQVLRYGVSHNVPKNTLEKAIKDYSKNQQSGSQLMVECRGPFNTFLIVEAFTDKPKWCRQELTRILKKYGGMPGNKGIAAHSFDYKGILSVALNDGDTPDMDAATERAIEAGAEDVTATSDENDTKILEYICDNTELHTVKKNLEETGVIVTEARLGYVPVSFNPLTAEELGILGEALDEIHSLDYIIRIYDNAEEKL